MKHIVVFIIIIISSLSCYGRVNESKKTNEEAEPSKKLFKKKWLQTKKQKKG